MRAFFKWSVITLGSLLVLLLLAVAGTAIFSKELTEFALEKVLAREVTIAGGFEVDWGRVVRVHAENVRVSNVEWAKEPAFFKTAVLDLAIDVPALIDGETVLPVVRLTRPELNLARSAEGKVNWEFGVKEQAPQEPTRAPVIPNIAKLTVENGNIAFSDLGLGSEVTAFIGTLQGQMTQAAVELHGRGKFEGSPLELDFTAAGTDALDGPAPYPVELVLAAGTTTARIAGTLSRPLEMAGLELTLALDGEGTRELETLVGISLPAFGHYRIAGELGQYGKIWSFTDFDGYIGESDLHGDLVLNFSGPRPAIGADLVSKKLDFDMLLALIDAAPKDKSEVAWKPQAPINLTELRAVDAYVQFIAHEILSTEFPIDQLAVELALEDGRLVVEPLRVGLGSGALAAAIRLDASAEVPSGRIELAFDQVALAPLAAPFKIDYPIRGIIDGELALAFSGEDIGIADGQIIYRAPERNTRLAISLDRIETERADLLKFAAEGIFRGEPANATFVGAPLTLLVTADHAYPINVEARIAKTQAAAKGTITALGKTFDLNISASGPGTAGLSKLIGVELPPLPAYSASGHVVRGEDDIKATSLRAKVGASDVSGSVLVNTQGSEPYVKADLKSQTLAYPDFDQLRKKEKKNEPFDLERLDAFNADVHITANRVIAPEKVVFSDVVVGAKVADGRLTLTPLKFSVAGGGVFANLAVGEKNDRLNGYIDANVDSVDLGTALQPIGLAERFQGTLDANLDLAFGPLDEAKGEAVILYREWDDNTDAKLVIDQTAESLEVEGTGLFHGENFQLSASIGELSKLLSNDLYPVDVDIEAVETEASIHGTIANPLQLKNLDLVLKIAGPNPERLYPILRLNLPDLPPYKIAGELSRHGETWQFEDFAGSVGDSVLTGDISVDTAGSKPFLRARLKSPYLDLDDLGPLIGRPPDERETASTQQAAEAERFAMRDRTLPDKPFNFDRLKAMDADVHFHADKIESDVAPLDDLTIDLSLIDGRMTLTPLAFGIAGGNVRLNAVLNARPEPAEGQVEAEIASVDLANLLQPFEIAKGTRGVIGGQASVSFKGSTAAQMLGNLDGDAKLLVRDGRLNALLVELAGIDGGESLLVWLQDGVQPVPLRCAFADLQAQDGTVAIERFAIDSTDTKFTMDGSVSLKEETLDLTIEAHPKDMSFFVARSPLKLEGTFKNPEFHVARGGLIARAAAALGLAVIAPPAALLALVEPGFGDNAPCAEFAQAMAPGAGSAGPRADD